MSLRVDSILSQGTGTAGEPIRMGNYEIVFPSLPGAPFTRDMSTVCNTMGLPNPTIAPMDVHHQNEKLKIAGEVDWAPVTVEIRDCIDPDVIRYLWSWFTLAYNPLTGQIGVCVGVQADEHPPGSIRPKACCSGNGGCTAHG